MFLYKSLVRSFEMAPHARTILKWFLWISASSFFINSILSHTLNLHIFTFYAHTWLGVLSISFTVFVVHRLLALIFDLYRRPLAIGALIVIAVVSLYSLYMGTRLPQVTRVTVPMQKLPSRLSGFTIVHLSDLHLDGSFSKKRLSRIVDRVNELKPDLVVITGDIIDGEVTKDMSFSQQLGRLKGKYGTIAVTGNHDFYAGINIYERLMKNSGITSLRNDIMSVAGDIQVVGLDDDEGRRSESGGKGKFEGLKSRIDKSKPAILLFHRPERFADAAAAGIDLQLSGHTHAGQVPPMDLLVWLVYRYPAGLYKDNHAYIYTSSGTGLWGPRMRFLSQNEIVHITLQAETPHR